jgi:hypothetical protein
MIFIAGGSSLDFVGWKEESRGTSFFSFRDMKKS